MWLPENFKFPAWSADITTGRSQERHRGTAAFQDGVPKPCFRTPPSPGVMWTGLLRQVHTGPKAPRATGHPAWQTAGLCLRLATTNLYPKEPKGD